MKLAIVNHLKSIRTGFEFRLRLFDDSTSFTNPAIIFFYKSLVTEKFERNSIELFFLFIITKNKTSKIGCNSNIFSLFFS